MPTPSFIIIGASRCGTTSLAKWLAAQQGIKMAQIFPEPKFFSRIDLYLKGVDEYLKHWPEDSDKFICGEKSTEYIECPEAPLRIERTLKDPKIIVVLRNPIHRAFSNFLWSRKNDLEPCRDFHTAIRKELSRNLMYSTCEPRWWTYVQRGFYVDQLVRWVSKQFDIHYLFYPQFIMDPRETATSLGKFLGSWLNHGIPFENANESCWNKKIPIHCFDFLKEVYREKNEELSDLIKSKVPLGWNSIFSSTIEQIFLRAKSTGEEMKQ